eukprot:6970741-Pyramimonas_sp.AAC.1
MASIRSTKRASRVHVAIVRTPLRASWAGHDPHQIMSWRTPLNTSIAGARTPSSSPARSTPVPPLALPSA